MGTSSLTFHEGLHLNNVVTVEPRLSVPAKGLPTISEMMNLQLLGVGIRCWKPGKAQDAWHGKTTIYLVPSNYFGVWGVVHHFCFFPKIEKPIDMDN